MANPIITLAAITARVLPAPLKRALYRLGPVTKFLRTSLNRATPRGLTEITVAAGALEGIRLGLDLQAEKDYWLGTYEIELQAALKDFIRPGMTVYDVGANIGYITLQLARTTTESGKVFAFEALPENVDRLKANLALNHMEQFVEVIHAAVVLAPGQVNFLRHRSTGMGKASGSAGRQEDYSDSLRVPGISLDSFVFGQGNPPPEVLKIDIEGGEILALPGMERLLHEIRPLLFLELHGEEAALGAWKVLSKASYTLHRMQPPGYPAISSPDKLGWKAYVIAKPA